MKSHPPQQPPLKIEILLSPLFKICQEAQPHYPSRKGTGCTLQLLEDFNAKIDNDEHETINGGPHVSTNGALLRDLIKYFNLEILKNNATESKWTRTNSNNVNETSAIDCIICNNKLTKNIAEVIINEKQEFVLTGKKKTDHNTIFLQIAAQPKKLQQRKKDLENK